MNVIAVGGERRMQLTQKPKTPYRDLSESLVKEDWNQAILPLRDSGIRQARIKTRSRNLLYLQPTLRPAHPEWHIDDKELKNIFHFPATLPQRLVSYPPKPIKKNKHQFYE